MLSKLIRGRTAPAEGSAPSVPAVAGPRTTDRPWVLHPFLLAIFPILSLYSHNVHELPLDVLFAPLSVAIGVVAVVWLTLRLIGRDALRAGMMTSLLGLLFFGYETLLNGIIAVLIWIDSFWTNREPRIEIGAMLTIEGLIAAVGFWRIYWRTARPEIWTKYLNAFTLILVALPVAGLVSARFREPVGIHHDGALPALKRTGATPDIYFILLDGYARSDIMRENYGFDNQPFLDRLARRGFFVANQSTSNYCQTALSLASILNADYLDELLEPNTQDLLVLADLIKKNRVADQLRSRGYQTVSFTTGFDLTDNPETDLYLAPGPGHSAFNDMLVQLTPIAPLLFDIHWNDRFSESRKRTQFVLDRLPSIARIPGPTFTVARFVCPHPPFLFGENGEDVSPRQFDPGRELMPHKLDPFIGSPEYVRQGYRNQSVFLTGRIERAVEQILKQSSEPPVIIIQSDHGAWLHYHPNDVDATQLRERFGTLNAILIPGLKYEGLTDDANSVNTFRIVFNNVFGTSLPLLPRRNYFSNLTNPFQFIDVTERLRTEKQRGQIFHSPDQFLGLKQQF